MARAAVKLILDTLDARAVTQLNFPQSPSPAARAKYRARTRRAVLDCTNCQLHRHQPLEVDPHGVIVPRLPVAYSGPTTARMVVVGEAPGPQESARGVPFIGPSGKLLRTLMREVDIDPEVDVLWCNTVSCFPNVEGKIRAPSEAESLACAGNLLAQVEAAYTPYVLLVGAHALRTFRSDLAVTQHHGRVFIWNEMYVVMGIIHPAAALRGASYYKRTIKEDLATWRDVVFGGDDPLRFLGDACIKCKTEAAEWDRDGVPWCGKHWARGKGQWLKERERFNRPVCEQLEVF